MINSPNSVTDPALAQKFAQLESTIPFILASQMKSGDTNGIGVWLQVTGAANADINIKHYLGYLPHFVTAWDNGTAYTPKVKRSAITPWTTVQVTVQFDVAPTNCWVWII